MEIPKYIRDNSLGTLTNSNNEVRFKAIFANYDARYIRINDRDFVKEYFIGRGSHSAMSSIESHTLDENISPILEIGRMCNYGRGSTILVDGEHANSEVMNIDFGQFPDVRRPLRDSNRITSPVRTKGKTVIGSGVLISNGVMILSGVTIGNGAVIGANAVVTKNVPAFSIVAGNPAKVIGYRFDEKTIEELQEIRWWDFEFTFLFSNLPLIQNMKTDQFIKNFGDLSKNKYVMENRSRFVFDVKNEKNRVQCIGCDIDGQFIPYNSLNKTIKFYIDQTLNAEDKPLYLVKNILDYRQS